MAISLSIALRIFKIRKSKQRPGFWSILVVALQICKEQGRGKTAQRFRELFFVPIHLVHKYLSKVKVKIPNVCSESIVSLENGGGGANAAIKWGKTHSALNWWSLALTLELFSVISTYICGSIILSQKKCNSLKQLRSFRWVRVRQDFVQVFCFLLAIWKYYQVFLATLTVVHRKMKHSKYNWRTPFR